jgi:hypothetical protein
MSGETGPMEHSMLTGSSLVLALEIEDQDENEFD